jgi:hypothetical protein
MNDQFQQFDQSKQTRYMSVSGNGMSVHTETIDPEKLIYRLEYGNSDVFHNHAIVNGMKRALSAIEHQFYDTKGRIKKTRLIYTDNFVSYREFDERGRLITDDNTTERVEFDYQEGSLLAVRITRPIYINFVSGVTPNITENEIKEIMRVLKTYPWATCFHQFNPFDSENMAQCSFSRMAATAIDKDHAILPTEFAIGGC